MSAVYGSRPLITSKPGSSSPERPGLDNITSQPWSDPTCPRATAFCTLSCCFRPKHRDKGEVSTIRGSTMEICVRPWLTLVLSRPGRSGGVEPGFEAIGGWETFRGGGARFRGDWRLGNINGALFLDGFCSQMSILCTFWHYVYSKTCSFLRLSGNPWTQFFVKLCSVW